MPAIPEVPWVPLKFKLYLIAYACSQMSNQLDPVYSVGHTIIVRVVWS
jgi:hypothetical protein